MSESQPWKFVVRKPIEAHDSKLLIHIDKAKLPKHLRDVLDPQKDVPSRYEFIPILKYVFIISLGASLIFLGAFAATVYGLVNLLQADPLSYANLSIVIVLALATLTGLLVNLKETLKGWHQDRQVKHNQWRRGNYFAKDHLFIYDGHHASLIPYAYIKDVKKVELNDEDFNVDYVAYLDIGQSESFYFELDSPFIMAKLKDMR